MAATITKGQAVQRRRTGVVREVIGFTTKPRPNAPSDGVKRARLVEPVTENETRVRVDQIRKTYIVLPDIS